MPRVPAVTGGRTERVSTALSPEEVARLIDEPRGPLGRAEWLRYVLERARRDGITFKK